MGSGEKWKEEIGIRESVSIRTGPGALGGEGELNRGGSRNEKRGTRIEIWPCGCLRGGWRETYEEDKEQ